MAYESTTGTHTYYKQINATKGNGGIPNAQGSFKKFEDDAEIPEYPGSTELPAESVLAMCQSIGVVISEDTAAALGELAMRKLRYATLLAIQFSEHENSTGLRVEDFSKAEDNLNAPSFGHKSNFPPPTLKSVSLGKISYLDEGPEIDVIASSKTADACEIFLEDLDPTLFRTEPYKSCSNTDMEDSTEAGDLDESDTSFDLNEIPLLDMQNNDCSSDQEVESENSEEELMPGNDESALVTFNHVDHSNVSNNIKEEEEEESNEYQIRISTNCFEDSTENHVEEVFGNGPTDINRDDENDIDSDVKDLTLELDNEGFELVNGSMEEDDEESILDHEWINYMEMFVECFLNDYHDEHDPCKFEKENECDEEDSTGDTGYNESTDTDDEKSKFDGFRTILTDLQKHGAYPVLDVICDLFRDYIRGLITPVSVIGLRRIFSVINAFLSCPSTPSVAQMRIMSSVLIEIFILPPPYEVQQYLTQVFMQILKKYDELLTWTCTYITEVLKKTMEMPSDDISEAYKTVIHGALCLINGLERLKIQIAQEFGWHTSIVNFSKTYYQHIDADFSEADGYIQEQILTFCRNFFQNYKRLVSSVEMQIIHTSMQDVFGEKLIPYLCKKGNFSSKLRFKKQNSGAGAAGLQNNISIRKGYYRNKKVKIPYKSLLSSGLL